MTQLLITGGRQVGKSTLLRKLVSRAGLPVYGFITQKISCLDGDRFYIFPASLPESRRVCSDENLIAIRKSFFTARPEVFDSLGTEYIRQAQKGGILLMDELGFLESEALLFQNEVFRALNGDIPVLAALRQKEDAEFLRRVRRCENTVLYTVTEQNRDALFYELAERFPIYR